jgi:hypothetical protein
MNQVVTKLNSTAGKIVSWTKNDDDEEGQLTSAKLFSLERRALENVSRFLHVAGTIADRLMNRVRNPKAYKVKRGGGRA